MKDTLGRENRKLNNRFCHRCGKEFRPLRESSKYCSRRCLWDGNGGFNKKQESWWKNSKGYIEGRIWLPDGTQISVKQHRFIMEGIIGRPLDKDEDVHHINGNKSDNRPGNLEIVPHGEHSKYHNKNREHKRGYNMNLSPQERRNRSLRAISMQLYKMGRDALRTSATGLPIEEVLK
ncbi:MAG: HNH endonuclease signature motif containing protein [Dehalococcoidia bacterium]|jgi:hypothetical protein